MTTCSALRRVALACVALTAGALGTEGCGINYRGDGPFVSVGLSSGARGVEPTLGFGYQAQARRGVGYRPAAIDNEPGPEMAAYMGAAYELAARVDVGLRTRAVDLTAQAGAQLIPPLLGTQLVTAVGARVDTRSGRVAPLWLLGAGVVGFDPRVGSHGGSGPPPGCRSSGGACSSALDDYVVELDWSVRADFLINVLTPMPRQWVARVGGSLHRQAW